MGFGEVGLDFQRLLVMGDRRVDLATASKNVTEVVVGSRVVGLDFQRLSVLGDRRVDLAAVARAKPRLLWASA